MSEKYFWNRIFKAFNANAAHERTKDQLTSKWRSIRADVAKFNAIHQTYSRNRHSGESDEQVMDQTRALFKLENNSNGFRYHEAWQIAKNKPKFFSQPPVDVQGRSMAKRKNFAVPINLEEEPEDYQPEMPVNLDDQSQPQQHPFLGEDLLQRPAGRFKARRTSGSSDAASSRSFSSSDVAASLDRLNVGRDQLNPVKNNLMEK